MLGVTVRVRVTVTVRVRVRVWVRVRFMFMVTYALVVIWCYQFSACLLSDRWSDAIIVQTQYRNYYWVFGSFRQILMYIGAVVCFIWTGKLPAYPYQISIICHCIMQQCNGFLVFVWSRVIKLVKGRQNYAEQRNRAVNSFGLVMNLAQWEHVSGGRVR